MTSTKPNETAKRWYQMGVNAETLDGAISCFKMAVLVKSDYADAYSGLGNALLEQGLAKEADKYLKIAEELKEGGSLEKKLEENFENIFKKEFEEAFRKNFEETFKRNFEEMFKIILGKEQIEPTYFYKGEQINEEFYEYVESIDIYVVAEHKTNLRETRKRSVKEKTAKSEFIFDKGSVCLIDDKGIILINELKAEAYEKAKDLAREMNYDGFFINGDNNRWKMIGLKQSRWSAFWGTYSNFTVRYNFRTMAECYRKVRKIDSNDISELNHFGWGLNAKGKHENAMKYFEKVIKLDPTHIKAHINLGVSYKGIGKHDEAIECWEKARELDPNNEFVKNKIANAHKSKGNFDAQDYHNQGRSLKNAKIKEESEEGKKSRLETAIEKYEVAIRLNPMNTWSYHDIGNCLQDLKRYNEAEEYYKKSIRISGNDDPVVNAHLLHHNLGVSLYRQGRYEEAIEVYQKAIAIKHYSWSFADMGFCQSNLGRYEEAEENLRKAISIIKEEHPPHAGIHYNLAKALAKQGKHEEAKKEQEMAIELAPEKAWLKNLE